MKFHFEMCHSPIITIVLFEEKLEKNCENQQQMHEIKYSFMRKGMYS